MSNVASVSEDPFAVPAGASVRRRLTAGLRMSLRALSIELSLLNHQVGESLGLRDVDLDCLDLISRRGPLSASALAQLARLHPATITGILDRLERAGWISRDRDPADRRAVVIRAVRDRAAEILGLYAGMNRAMETLCAGYDEAQLELISDFLRRTAEAGQAATAALTGEVDPGVIRATRRRSAD
jgi:DNA-binding MarR family transcriptional regulator